VPHIYCNLVVELADLQAVLVAVQTMLGVVVNTHIQVVMVVLEVLAVQVRVL
jgi:hypothetical protein